ncbi:hypothetical protein Droror1_Dr00012513 [Drosera rotundifolia]
MHLKSPGITNLKQCVGDQFEYKVSCCVLATAEIVVHGAQFRLLKALGAPRSTRLYIAGGQPCGGDRAMKPLVEEFPNLTTKETLARGNELAPFINRSSVMAALDYIVSLSSDVFMPSHGGNMARAMQGHRAYSGHRKFIKPNKRMMLPFFEDEFVSEDEFGAIIRKLHEKSYGQPESRTGKRGRNRHRDVIAYPVPECMCRDNSCLFRAT